MNNQTKLILALHQIDNLTSLLEGNDWQKFLYSHLVPIQVELQRQLSLQKASQTPGQDPTTGVKVLLDNKPP